jgi:hypothetical protein
MNEDHKVSELCLLPDNKLSKLLEERSVKLVENNNGYNYFIIQIVKAALMYDEIYFEKLFSGCILRFGIKGSYVHIMYPVLERVGLWWLKDELQPAQEHFITNLFRQKLFAVIDSLPPAVNGKNIWLLFLPEDEFHEMGLLFSNFLLRQAGRKVIYLGENIPFDSLKSAVKETGAATILFFLVRKNDIEEDEKFIGLMKKNFIQQKVYVACEAGRLKDIRLAKNFTQLNTVSELEKSIETNV